MNDMNSVLTGCSLPIHFYKAIWATILQCEWVRLDSFKPNKWMYVNTLDFVQAMNSAV